MPRQISAAAQLHPRQISSLAQEVAVFARGYETGNHPSRLRANAEANVGTSLPMIQTCLCFGATMHATNSAGAIAIGRCVVVGSTQTQKYIRFVSLFFKLIQRPRQPSTDLYPLSPPSNSVSLSLLDSGPAETAVTKASSWRAGRARGGRAGRARRGGRP